jgi:hypothetical protein
MARWRQPGAQEMLQTFLLLKLVAFLLASCRARTTSDRLPAASTTRHRPRLRTGQLRNLH